MFGCLGRIGCLIILVVAGAIGWFTQDAWLPRVKAQANSTAPGLVRKVREIAGKGGGTSPTASAKSPATEPQWVALSAAGAERGREAVAKLNQKNGPAYVNVGAADLAAFVLDSILHGFSPSASGAQAIAKNDRIYMKAMVSVADLGGPKTLGPLSAMVSGKQELTIVGKLEVLSPGKAQLRVEEISLGELKVPTALIPKLVQRLGVKGRDASTPGDAIPVHVPNSLADVRVNKGHVTLYKTTP